MTVLENRYYILFGKETSWRKIRVPVLAMNYILAFIYPLPAFLNFPDQSIALAQILQVSEVGFSEADSNQMTLRKNSETSPASRLYSPSPNHCLCN